MHDAQYQVHRRKRVSQKKLEPYPTENKWKNLMDELIYIFGIIGPLLTIPQILRIWFEKDASGVSVISWLGFSVIAIFWIIYGIMHKEKPIIFTYILWLIAEMIIIIGVFIYG